MSVERKVIYLLISMYTAGWIGLNIPASTELFKQLTPYNLLFSAAVLLYFQRDKNVAFWMFTAFTVLLGYFIEVLGVNTGLIFGDYEYTKTLGFEIWNVPPVIGINWLIIAVGAGNVVHKWLSTRGLITLYLAIIAAFSMTAFDYIAEPIAIRLEMWEWATEIPPLSNYLGWLGISLIIQLVYFYAPFKKENPIAAWLFALQVLFFSLQWFF